MQATLSLVVMLLACIGNVTVWALDSLASLVVENHIKFLARNRAKVSQPVASLVTRLS
jgi:hypothetical protein